jgi:PAS domain S-box-containing protein
MYGLISQVNSGGNIRFYRAMALGGLMTSMFFTFVFNFILIDVHEIILDRAIVMLYCAIVFAIGFKKGLNQRSYSLYMYAGFYIYLFQSLFACWYNDFSGAYFPIFILINLICIYAFRKDREAIVFSIIGSSTAILLIVCSRTILANDKWVFVATVLSSNMLSVFTARIKNKFMREMKLNQKILKSLITRTENGMFVTDTTGLIYDVNQRAIEIFGYAKEELLDVDFRVLRKNPLTQAEIEEGFSQLNEEHFWTQETLLTKKDGTEFKARIAIIQLTTHNRKFLVYRVQDISKLKMYQEELLQAKEKAEEAAKAKSNFLAIMSHEIRTPLNGVIATSSLLKQSELNAEQCEQLDTIYRSGQNLLMLINDILEFSKMENGKLELDPHPSNIQLAIFDVSGLLRASAEQKGIQLEVNVSNNLPASLILDDHRLKQILLNLTGNAIKFTSKGKVSIECHLEKTNRNQHYIQFKIADTGIGIPAEKIPLLFQSFTQVDAGISRKYGGSGLGLTISKQLVELMGGQIEVSSAHGQGTCFSFGLWFAESVFQSYSNDTDGDDCDFSNLQVLIAEDNKINIQVFKFILDRINISADFAENGLEALEAHQRKQYDLIFMDMQMPELDGLEAAKKIRAQSGHQPIIIAISANAYPEDRKLCQEAGMEDFMPKPFELEKVKSMMRAHFPEKSAKKPAA